jgi:hypothetical protein
VYMVASPCGEWKPEYAATKYVQEHNVNTRIMPLSKGGP